MKPISARPSRTRAHALAAAGAGLAVALCAVFVPTAPAASATAAACAATTPGGPVQVTAGCIDPLYGNPVIDSEQDVSEPLAYHRVSGHFEGTAVNFTIALPPAKQWRGRFFQYTYPLTNEKPDERAVGFAIASGGYAVQAGGAGNTLGYRHSAAAAKFAKTVAANYYGSGSRRIFGYLYGPSGGSFQTVGAMENTTGVWDGFVPIVMGVPMSTPYTFFIRAMAELVLGDKADQISDAMLPGGSGQPYAGLDAAEKTMLHELTSFGVPLRAWENPNYLLGLKPSFPDGLLGFGPVVRALDPTYVDDFWNKPGYLGTEQSPLGDAVRAALAKAGDSVDNRWDIALRSYYRHQVPPVDQGYQGFDQFRASDGTPLYPQRASLIGPTITRSVGGGASFTGNISGKVIVVDNLYDVDALPWHADWYAKRVKAALGTQGFENKFRLYYNDHADHLEEPVAGVRATYLVSYYGLVEQALRDVAEWAESDVSPPASTHYTVEEQQVSVPEDATARAGIQPTVRLAIRGATKVDVKVGQPVAFTATIAAPPGTGKVVSTAWDFEGDGTYAEAALGQPKPQVLTQQVHRFAEPGVYFVAVRATVQRDGVAGPYAQVQNLDRVRVVVRR